MAMSKIPFSEKLTAEIISLSSRAAVAVPLLGRLTVGSAEGHGVIVPYYRAETVASEIPAWEAFAANPDAGRLPRTQKEIAMITVSEEYVAAERRRLAENGTESRMAVAWALGEAVMVGEIPDWDDMSKRSATFGMRVGPEPLKVAPALWLPGNRVHVPETGFVDLAQKISLEALPESVPVY